MGKGLSMKVALSLKSGNLVHADNPNLQKEDFLCHDCRTPVIHVKGYQKCSSSCTIPPIFRLMNNCEHNKNCQYIAKNSIINIVRKSKDVMDIYNPFSTKNDGIYIFRLNIPFQAYMRERNNGNIQTNTSKRHDIENIRIRMDYILSKEYLKPYCSSATGLAKIFFQSGNLISQKEISSNIKINFNSHIIKWEDFFFSIENYDRLYNHLQNTSLSIPMPIAILIEVKSIEFLDKTPRRNLYRVNCLTKKISNNENDIRVSPTIYTTHKNLIANFSEKERYIVFGMAQWKEKKWDKGGKNITYIDVTFTICNDSQFAHTPYQDIKEINCSTS